MARHGKTPFPFASLHGELRPATEDDSAVDADDTVDDAAEGAEPTGETLVLDEDVRGDDDTRDADEDDLDEDDDDDEHAIPTYAEAVDTTAPAEACTITELRVLNNGRFQAQMKGDICALSFISSDETFMTHVPRLNAREGAATHAGEHALEPVMNVAGVVRGLFAVPVEATAKLSHCQAEQTATHRFGPSRQRTDERGRFGFKRLPLGCYDISFKAAEYRRRTLHDLRHDAAALDISLARAAVLRGATAPACATWVDVRANDGNTWSAEGERECTFAVSGIDFAGEAVVTAEMSGRTVSRTVPIPAYGDPPFLCLAGPCARDSAVLLLVPQVSGHQDILVNSERDDYGFLNVYLTAGIPFAMTAPAPGHAVNIFVGDLTPIHLTPGPGVTEVLLPAR